MHSRFINFLSSLLLPLLLWLLDFYTKNWAKNLETSIDLKFIKFDLVYNSGFIMGWLSQTPQNAKMTIIATMGTIVFGSYTIFAIFAHKASIHLRIGASFLISGIIGNVTDRVAGDAVVDFITHSFGSFHTPIYNLADFFQWVGYALITFGIYQESKNFLFKKDLRNNFFINKNFQIRSSLLLAFISFFVGLVFIVFGFTFFKDEFNSSFSNFYFASSLSLLFFLSLIVFLVGLVLSHRIAGPIYATFKYLNESFEGHKPPLKLRTNDEFKEIFEKECTQLNKRINDLKNSI